MKRLSIGISAVASLVATARLPPICLKAPIYTKAPVYVDPGYDWTGFYVGGNVGYSWGNSNVPTLTDPGPPSTMLNSASNKFNMDGVVGGGQIGYNWQRDRWVFGLEADIQGTGQAGNGTLLRRRHRCRPEQPLRLGSHWRLPPFNVPAFPVTGTLAEVSTGLAPFGAASADRYSEIAALRDGRSGLRRSRRHHPSAATISPARRGSTLDHYPFAAGSQ